jgi:hypothetical protein
LSPGSIDARSRRLDPSRHFESLARMNSPRPDRNPSIQFATWTRDAWHCRFCARPVFFGPALRELERLAPGHAYYHAHGRTSVMLPLLADSWVAAHHLVSKSDGGESTPDNGVTACMSCNTLFNRS